MATRCLRCRNTGELEHDSVTDLETAFPLCILCVMLNVHKSHIRLIRDLGSGRGGGGGGSDGWRGVGGYLGTACHALRPVKIEETVCHRQNIINAKELGAQPARSDLCVLCNSLFQQLRGTESQRQESERPAVGT